MGRCIHRGQRMALHMVGISRCRRFDRPDGSPQELCADVRLNVRGAADLRRQLLRIRIHEITEMQVANMGNYAHGNQPAHHIIYLYDYCGQPHKAQWWVREVMDRLYSAKPDGYCGDEDNGQTSAWYAFSALGFYPVCPASDEYAVGSPLFKHATIHLENGNDIVIEAPENSPENRYVGSMTFDGEELEKPCLKYSELKMGAKILFDMQAQK